MPLSFTLKLRDGLILARRQTSVFCILCATTTHQDQPEVYTCLQLCWAAQDIGTDKIMNNSISGRWWTDRVFIPELYHSLLCRTDQSNCAISRNNTIGQLAFFEKCWAIYDPSIRNHVSLAFLHFHNSVFQTLLNINNKRNDWTAVLSL